MLTLPPIVRPKEVVRAASVIAISVVIGLLGEVHNWLETPGSPIALSVSILVELFLCIATWKIYDGKKWARSAYTAFTIFGTSIFLWGLSKYPEFYTAIWHQSFISWLLFVFTGVAEVYALVLLFTRPGSEWFT